MHSTSSESYDTVIVGGGTAGCIVAGRISENPHHRVFVLEAGPDYLPGSQGANVAAVQDARIVPMHGHTPNFEHSHDWNLNAVMPDGASMAVPQARLIGGGSAINCSIALRGSLVDVKKWEAPGNPS